MTKILALFALLCVSASAQVTTINQGDTVDYRVLNQNFGWTVANKAGLGTCATGTFAVQTTAGTPTCLAVDWTVVTGKPTTWAWAALTGVPSTFAPSAHASAHLPGGGDPISLWGSGTRPVAANALGPAGECAQWSAVGLVSSGAPCGTGIGGGEANTASNAGTGGISLVLAKVGTDLPFKSLFAASPKIIVTDDTGNKRITLDVDPTALDHTLLLNHGTNTHAQIDTHLAATNNPHSTTAAQVGAPALSLLTGLGDTTYRDAGTWARLAGNTATTRKFLRQQGDGTNSAAPGWDTFLASDIPNIAESQVTSLVPDLALKAPLASPALTGVPTVPTAAADTNTTQAASVAFVLGQAGSATPGMDGSASPGTSPRYARQDHLHPVDTSRAPIASPTFTGLVTAPGGFSTGSSFSASGPAVTLTTGLASARPSCSTSPIAYLASDTHALTVCNISTTTWGSSLNPTGSYAEIFDLSTAKWECYKDDGTSCAPSSSGGTALNVDGVAVTGTANLSSTTPAAESGYRQIKFQKDVSNNVSAEAPPIAPADLPLEAKCNGTWTSNLLSCTPAAVAPTGYTVGEHYYAWAPTCNVGSPVTVKFWTLASVTVKKFGGSTDLASGDACGWLDFEFDANGNMSLQSPVANAPGSALTNPDLGGTALSNTVTAGTGGVTAGHIVQKTTDAPTTYVNASTAAAQVKGIARATVLAAASFQMVTTGFVGCVIEGTVTAGHYWTYGSTDKSKCADTGSAAFSTISNAVRVGGVFQASGTDGQTISVSVLQNASGAQVDTIVSTAPVAKRTACIVATGTGSAGVLQDADLADLMPSALVPIAVTVQEVTIRADAGTPNVIMSKTHGATVTDLVSGALATAASGGIACSKATAVTGLDGVTTCSATLVTAGSANVLAAGDWLTMRSGTAGGTAKRLSACVTYTVN